MNQEEYIRNIIPNGVPIKISDQLYTVEQVHCNKVYAKHFIDFSRDVLGNNFELRDYQEKILSDEYYKNTKELQWNLYLHFILNDEDYSLAIDQGVKRDIEKDTIYARKIVHNKEVDEAGKKSSGTPELPTDIVSLWREKLYELNLSPVYDLQNYKHINRAVKAIVSGDIKREEEVERYNSDSDFNIQIGEVEELCLAEVKRKYPIKRNFDFSDVNLIYGVNGAGKTTIIEAIEYWCTGNTSREYLSKSKGVFDFGSVTMKTSSSNNPISSQKISKSLLRERDLSWYGNYSKTQVKTIDGFIRCNSFNCNGLNSIDKGEDIRNYISSIVLGEEINTLKDRSHSILDKLQSEKKEIRTNIERITEEVNYLISVVDRSDVNPDAFENYKISFKEEIKNSKYTSLINNKYEPYELNYISDLKNELLLIEEYIEHLNKNKLTGLDLNSALKEKQLVEDLLVEILNLKNRLKDIKKTNNEEKLFIDNKKDELNLVKSIRKLISIDPHLHLSSIATDIQAKTRKLERLSILSEKLSNLQGIPNYSSQYVNNKLGSLNEKIKSKKEISHDLKSTKATLVSNLGELKKLESEITSSAIKYTQLANNDVCPVCKTEHKEGLVNRIQKFKLPKDSIKQGVIDLEEKISEVSKEIDDIRSLISVYETIIHITNQLKDIGYEESTKKPDIDKLLEIEKQDLNNLKSLNSNLIDSGFTGEVIEELNTKLVDKYGVSITSHEDIDLGNKEESCLRELNDMYLNREKNVEIQEGLEINLKKCIGKVTDTIVEYDSDVGIESCLQNYIISLNKAHWYYSNMKVEGVADINQLHSAFSEIGGLVKKQNDLYDLYIKTQNLLNNTYKNQNRIKELKKELLKYNHQESNIIEIYENIRNLLKQYSSEEHVNNFLNNNIESINKIYKQIHAPREIEEIIINSEGDIELIDIDNNSRKDHQISTGQRTALALSIFITLHQAATNSAKAPKFILLDDPVSNVDDLNIIAFFDYLRDLVINGTQVVFVTADSKIAGLFEMKFKFMGHRFTKEQLIR